MKTRMDFVSNSSSSSYVIRYESKKKFIEFVKKYRYLLANINFVRYESSDNDDCGRSLVDDEIFDKLISDIQEPGVYGLEVGNPDQEMEAYNVALYTLLVIAEQSGFNVEGYHDMSFHNDWLSLKDLEREYIKDKADSSHE